MQYYQATQAHLQIQLSIPNMIKEGIRDWIDRVPSRVLVASEVVTFQRGSELVQRRQWHIELRDLDVVRVFRARFRSIYCEGPKFIIGL